MYERWSRRFRAKNDVIRDVMGALAARAHINTTRYTTVHFPQLTQFSDGRLREQSDYR